ncbi:DUF885 domain-containing protein [Rheinheimera sp.]|uniref:DUF885 domain-containing protein n=1 Tax=Rheinheimera sp. TaxID=1869214 RepID=UPI00307ECC24
MQRTLIALGLTLSLAACTAKVSSPAVDFEQLSAQIWQQQQQLSDRSSTSLPDMSPEALEKKQQKRLELLQQLQQTELKGLTEQQKINHQILLYGLQDAVDEYRFGAHYMPLTSESGFHSSLGFMVSGTDFSSARSYQDYLKKLSTVPRYMQQQTDWMRRGIEKGLTQPKAVLAGYEQGIQAYISQNPEQSIFFRPFRQQPHFVSDADWLSLQLQAKTLISEQINPAYQQFYDFFLQSYLPAAREQIGASSLPQGREFYQNRLEHYTTLKMTPQQVHQLGLEEVARIKTEMQQVIAQVGFHGSFADFIEFLRTDPQFYAKTATELLKEASFIAKKADAQLPALFKTLPRQPYGVAPVPAEIAPKYTSGRYAGSGRADRAGFYWVNTYALNRRPLYELEALTLHEAVPGHHLQIALAAEMADQPDYRRNFYTSAFGEGWGLYSEYLGLEMGFYQDPYSNFGRLTYEMWRACRLVVDTGMHALGWSRQQALDYLGSHTALSMHNVTTEIDRYISWPAQALSYKLGEITIKKLRRQAEQQLGDKFNLRDFHEAVLRNGSVPLSQLELQVTQYIEQAGKA